MGKRNHGSGSIFPHPTKPGYLRGLLRYNDPRTGRRTSKSFIGTKRGDIERQFAVFLGELKSENDTPSTEHDNDTVDRLITEWWNTVEGNYRHSTAETYNSYLKLLDSELKCLRVRDVSSTQLARFLERLAKGGRSENTRRNALRVLKVAWNFGLQMEWITKTLPRLPRILIPAASESRQESFTPEDEMKLTRFVQSDTQWRALVMLAFDSGMRQSEILGLNWSSVAFDTGIIIVRDTAYTRRAATKSVIRKTKTNASNRTIKVSSATLQALLKWRMVSRASGLVFPTVNGGPKRQRDFLKAWRRLLSRAGVRYYSPHATRHTCATRLLAIGMSPYDVQERLGHEDVTTTLKLYGHAIPGGQNRCATAYDTFLTKDCLVDCLPEHPKAV